MMGFFKKDERDIELVRLKADLDDYSETISNLHQQIGELTQQINTMKRHREDSEIEKIASEAAREIEDQYVRGNPMGRNGQQLYVRRVIQALIHRTLEGSKPWNLS